MLADAGYADGFSLTLTYAAENDTEDAFAPLLKDAFAEIGVDLTIEPGETVIRRVKPVQGVNLRE